MISLSGYKVIYQEKVLNALSIECIMFDEEHEKKVIDKPQFIEILVINSDGQIQSIRDSSWKFQFLPIVSGDRNVF